MSTRPPTYQTRECTPVGSGSQLICIRLGVLDVLVETSVAQKETIAFSDIVDRGARVHNLVTNLLILYAVWSRSQYYNLPYNPQAEKWIHKALLYEVRLPSHSLIPAAPILTRFQARARRIRYSGKSPSRLVILTKAGIRSYVVPTTAFAFADNSRRYLDMNGLSLLSPDDRGLTKLTKRQVCTMSPTSTCPVP